MTRKMKLLALLHKKAKKADSLEVKNVLLKIAEITQRLNERESFEFIGYVLEILKPEVNKKRIKNNLSRKYSSVA